MEDNIIFSLTGRSGSGKDVVGEMIKLYLKELGMTGFTIAFADPLKFHCMRNLGYVDKDNDRHILQEFGTKVREIEPLFWVRQTYNTIDAFRSLFDVFIITDCRYENEMCPYPWNICYPIANVLIKRDNAHDLGEDGKHESEQMANEGDESKFHYVIDNNGSLEDTYKQVRDMVNDVLMKKADFVHSLEDISPELKEQFEKVVEEFVDAE